MGNLWGNGEFFHRFPTLFCFILLFCLLSEGFNFAGGIHPVNIPSFLKKQAMYDPASVFFSSPYGFKTKIPFSHAPPTSPPG